MHGRERNTNPDTLCLCECIECVEYPLPSQNSSIPKFGQWLTRKELEAHRTRDRRQALAARALTGTQSKRPRSGSPEPRPAKYHGRPRSAAPLASPAGEAEVEFHGDESNQARIPVEFEDVYERLGCLLAELKDPRDVVPPNLIFDFAVPPHYSSHPPTSQSQIDDVCALDPNFHSNNVLLGYIDHLAGVRRYALQHGRPEDVPRQVYLRGLVARNTVDRHKDVLRERYFQDWMRQYRFKEQLNLVNTARRFRNQLKYLPPAVLTIYLLVASLHLLSNTSQDDCRFILNSLSLAMRLLPISSSSTHGSLSIQNMLHDVDQVVRLLDIYPRFTAFACCPKCFMIHYLNPDDVQSHYPERCIQETGKGVCNARLRKTKEVLDAKREAYITKDVPIREYRYQSPQEYLAYIFSRSDLKQYLYGDPCERSRDANDAWDIWDASALRDFTYIDGRRFTDSDDECRLVFSLNMDGLNPFTNKEAGKKVSIGAIYMVCLNLPPSIRYKLENIYLVGIIPGPRPPSLHDLNHLLNPLVDDFLLLWRQGFYLSRTCLHPHGIRVRGAIIPLICDLPAARHMSGFASYSHTIFCSECKQTLPNINDLNHTCWTPRTWEEHRKAAKLWRDAQSIQERKTLYSTYGLRWSELLRLPYWDPTKYTLIDSMHAFYLRIFQHHIRNIWGMDVKMDDQEGILFNPDAYAPTEVEMKHGHWVLRHGSEERLTLLKKKVLRELCKDTGVLTIDGARNDLLSQLLQYRIDQNWWTPDRRHIRDDASAHCIRVDKDETLKDGTTSDDFFWHASKSRAKSASKDDLKKVFECHVLPVTRPPWSQEQLSKLKKSELLAYIQSERQRLQIIQDDGIHISNGATRPRNQCANILGRTVLKEIRRDMQTINRPSWQPNGPRWPGEAKFGKFTAAQWKSFCLINLPITLTRLWGGAAEGSIQRQCLDNFMHLVTAVKLASMNRMNENRVTQYEYHIRQYLSTLLELYDTTITPYQHLSLHFGRHLRMFGPVHAWRCFPFERYNNVVQSFSTNNKFSDLEKTVFGKFISAQHIRGIFAEQDKLPGDLADLSKHFDETYGQKRQVKIGDILMEDPRYQVAEVHTWQPNQLTPVDPIVYRALAQWVSQNDPACTSCPNVAYFRHSVQRFGQVFSICDHHRNNSQVSFQKEPSAQTWAAGHILDLFSHTRVSNGVDVAQTFAILSPYEELAEEDAKLDVYRRYSVVAGRMFYNRMSADRFLVPFSNVNCHCVSQVQRFPGIVAQCILVQPLDQQ
ncbi:hypothetical protein EST38_g11717 [Candolleomyces aberdarensis]|uniref:Transposase family Tnp2 protein n=1 Tax=Candolleomyces aberdarensis TaxID=2316362 RepID=A0A4Q2D6U7_9AGAR|nr:hypothetical protein EST38_g11717 [Candolleomyces aberdarensis]